MIFYREYSFKSKTTMDVVKSKLIELKKISRGGWYFSVIKKNESFILSPNFYNEIYSFRPEIVVSIENEKEHCSIKVVSRLSLNIKFLFLFACIINIPIIGYSFYIENIFFSWGLMIAMMLFYLQLYVIYSQLTKRIIDILTIRLQLIQQEQS
jgi:hypothetical protein